MKGGICRRLEALEEQSRRQAPRPSFDARRRLGEHLDRIAALRRGELGSEEEAEVEATSAALQRRLAEIRGEGA